MSPPPEGRRKGEREKDDPIVLRRADSHVSVRDGLENSTGSCSQTPRCIGALIISTIDHQACPDTLSVIRCPVYASRSGSWRSHGAHGGTPVVELVRYFDWDGKRR